MKRITITITLTLCFLLALAIGASHASTPWKISGIYMDACSCDVPCMCHLGEMPTDGVCRGFLNWHIVHGFYGDVSLNDINVSILDIFPNEDSKDTIATYISDNASPEQFEAIKNIVEEVMESFASRDLGVKLAPITFGMSGDTYTWSIPDILEIKSTIRRDIPSVPGYFAPTYHSAEAEIHKFGDYDLDWDYSGKSSWQGMLLLPPEEPSDKVMGTIRTGVGAVGVAVNPYTRMAIVANTTDGTVSLFDLTTQEVTKTILVGNGTNGPAINPYTNVAVVANMGDNTASIIDLASGTVKKHIPVGKTPLCVGIDVVRNIAVLANMDSNDVSVIDLTTEEVIKTIPVGAAPACMHYCVNPYTNQAIVANYGENTLSIIDLEEGVEIKRIPVGKAPDGPALNPYTNMAVVPNWESNDVSIVDLTAGKVISTIPVGKGPACGVIEPTTNLALISNTLDDTVSVINLNTMSVVDTIPVGIYPACFAIDEATMTALITNVNSNDMTIIDLKKIPAAEDYSNVFFLELDPGLNMISLPLKPHEEMTARDLMNETGSTIVIGYDTDTNRYVGFTGADSGDGFPLEGGKGYIVNVHQGKVVPFVGAAWTNDVPVFMPAPPAEISSEGWAFVVSGNLADYQGGSYTVTARNLRTGDVAANPVTSGRFNAVFADLSRNPVIKAGDKVEIVIKDSTGNIVSGPVTYQISRDDIGQAFKDIPLRYGYVLPQKSVLLQNYPNPFNPETWIPFQLAGEADVSVRIYDASGRLVRNLALGLRETGVYMEKDRAAYWDGKSDAGEEVASGVYFYTIQAGEFSSTRKMTVRK